MPLVASVVLITGLRLRGFILAPEASRSSWTFCWMAETSRPLRGMTLSRLLAKREYLCDMGVSRKATHHRNHGG